MLSPQRGAEGQSPPLREVVEGLDSPSIRARLSKSLRKVETHPGESQELLESTVSCFALSISGRGKTSPALCTEPLFPSCFPLSRQGRDASWPANSPSSVLARATSFDPFHISPRCFKPQHLGKEDPRSQHCRVRTDANIQSLLLPLAVGLLPHHTHNGAQQQPLKIPVAPSLSPGTLCCPTRPYTDGGQLGVIPHSPVTLSSPTSPSSSLNIFVEIKSRPLEYLERVLQV